jgi:hypothetical protein
VAFSKADALRLAQPVQALSNGFGNRRCQALTRELCKLFGELVGLLILDIHAHGYTILPCIYTFIPFMKFVNGCSRHFHLAKQRHDLPRAEPRHGLGSFPSSFSRIAWSKKPGQITNSPRRRTLLSSRNMTRKFACQSNPENSRVAGCFSQTKHHGFRIWKVNSSCFRMDVMMIRSTASVRPWRMKCQNVFGTKGT